MENYIYSQLSKVDEDLVMKNFIQIDTILSNGLISTMSPFERSMLDQKIQFGFVLKTWACDIYQRVRKKLLRTHNVDIDKWIGG